MTASRETTPGSQSDVVYLESPSRGQAIAAWDEGGGQTFSGHNRFQIPLMFDFRNINTLWASVLVETLVHLGLTTAVISPGSRSTSLTVACARHSRVDTIPILDERSASFFALGYAKASGQAALLICTSGTAGANYFPAIIEAYESQVPLFVLTADRPPELRDCASGQTIDQQKLFGRYVHHYAELAVPEANVKQLRFLRQVIVQAWQCAHYPIPGPVHLNCPFRDPLAPLQDASVQALSTALDKTFFRHLLSNPNPSSRRGFAAGQFPHKTPYAAIPGRPNSNSRDMAPFPLANEANALINRLPTGLGQSERGLIIAGPAQPQQPQAYCEKIATLSKNLGWPVLADGLSPLRNWASLNPYLVITYDMLLRHPSQWEALLPEQVIQLGPLPTSKVLRGWLEQIDPMRWVITDSGRNQDPLHGSVIHLPLSLETLVAGLSPLLRSATAYCRDWCKRDAIARQQLTDYMQALPDLFEGKLSWLLPSLLPPQTALVVANSMPVRDIEWFWPLNDRGIQPHFNRGANGIDGTLSTALGVAHYHKQVVLLTGDLALLHDSNGFLNAVHRDSHLTILLVNNQGGGIFEMLPISQFEPPFETFFATPQQVNFATLAAAHGVVYDAIQTWEMLEAALSQFPASGVRLLELTCDRKQDAQRRTALLSSLGTFDKSRVDE